MQKYKSNLTSVSGAAVRGASITVLDESGATASIFLDRAGDLPAGNPLKTAQDGTFEFYAANGRYSLRTDSSGLNVLEEDVILMFDPDDAAVSGPIADAIQDAKDSADQAQQSAANAQDSADEAQASANEAKQSTEQLMSDLASPNVGASLINVEGELASETFGRMNNATGGLHRRKLLVDLPLVFPDYMAILAANGFNNDTGFIYPGSFSIDEEAREYLVFMAPSWVGNSYLVIYDMDTKAYKGYVQTVRSFCEGVEVTRYYGARKLFVADAQLGNIYEYSFPASAVYAGNVIAQDVIHNVGVYNQFSFNQKNGIWAIEQLTPPVGQFIARCNLALFNSSFSRVGSISMDVSSSGYVTPTSNAAAKRWPKRQGFALGDGIIATSHGASHDPATGTEPVYFQGTRVLDSSGTARLRESICRPDQFKTLIQQVVGGDVPTRIENEGCKFLSDGTLAALYVHKTRFDAGVNTVSGLAILREYQGAGDCVDFESAVARNTPWLNLRSEVGTFPRSPSGYVNPDTGDLFTTLNDVCDYLALSNRGVFSFYTSSASLTDFEGSAIPTGVFVSVTNLNGLTFSIEQRAPGGVNARRYYATGAVGTSRTTTTGAMRASELTLDAGVVGTGQKLCRISTMGYDVSHARFLGVDLQANNASSNVFIGGGSSTFAAATSVQLVTAASINTLVGLTRWLVNDTGMFRPGLDNAYQIGYSDFRVKDLFLANAPTVSSDGRLKQQQRCLTAAEKAAAAEIRTLPCAYKMTDAVLQKGDGNARWHYGVYAQDVIEVLDRHGVDWTQCGFVCFDQWGDEYVEHDALYQDSEIIGADGLPVKTLIKEAWTEKVREAGERYSIRYQELSMFLLAASA